MNYHSRNDETIDHPDWNQSPHALNSDATTRADLNGIVNLRQLREQDSNPCVEDQDVIAELRQTENDGHPSVSPESKTRSKLHVKSIETGTVLRDSSNTTHRASLKPPNLVRKVRIVLVKYAQFVGPGFLIAVAYIDPGNYATDVEAGASTKYRHLFIVLMSNLFAIFLQSLCIKLGSVTGLNLAENCRRHLPWWLNIILYLFAESAIIATDIAEVCYQSSQSLSIKN